MDFRAMRGAKRFRLDSAKVIRRPDNCRFADLLENAAAERQASQSQ
jgi:hypothetical protein